MTIPFGRRRLVVQVIPVPGGKNRPDVPAAVEASDRELAQLNSGRIRSIDLHRYEAASLLYGSPRAR